MTCAQFQVPTKLEDISDRVSIATGIVVKYAHLSYDGLILNLQQERAIWDWVLSQHWPDLRSTRLSSVLKIIAIYRTFLFNQIFLSKNNFNFIPTHANTARFNNVKEYKDAIKERKDLTLPAVSISSVAANIIFLAKLFT